MTAHSGRKDFHGGDFICLAITHCLQRKCLQASPYTFCFGILKLACNMKHFRRNASESFLHT